MSKRAAAVQLTSDNYEVEEQEYEEAGQFEVASEDQLKQRVIKKAARRTNASSVMNGGGLFAGLKPLSSSALAPTSFSLGGLSGSSGLLGRAPLSSITPLTSISSVKSNEEHNNGLPSFNSKGKASSDSEYLNQLKALNVGVTEWISSHVKKNPHVDLTPIFRDYEKHLKTIDAKYKPPSTSETDSCAESEPGESSSQATGEGEGEGEEVSSQVTADTDSVVTGDDEESQKSVESQSVASSVSSSQDCDDDSLMSTRAKLFYKKAEEFTELGVGTLKVQSSSGESVRLLLRNDTALGKVLMNVRLTPDVPTTLTKNNIIIVCPPNPPLGKKGEGEEGVVTYLIRVKTVAMAEKLHSTIKENMK